MSNKDLRSKPHQQIKRHGRKNFRVWRKQSRNGNMKGNVKYF